MVSLGINLVLLWSYACNIKLYRLYMTNFMEITWKFTVIDLFIYAAMGMVDIMYHHRHHHHHDRSSSWKMPISNMNIIHECRLLLLIFSLRRRNVYDMCALCTVIGRRPMNRNNNFSFFSSLSPFFGIGGFFGIYSRTSRAISCTWGFLARITNRTLHVWPFCRLCARTTAHTAVCNNA